MIAGSTYLERGKPVVVVAAWRQQRVTERVDLGPLVQLGTSSPRNVWIRRADGTEAVRPFRGLRKPVGDVAA